MRARCDVCGEQRGHCSALEHRWYVEKLEHECEVAGHELDCGRCGNGNPLDAGVLVLPRGWTYTPLPRPDLPDPGIRRRQ